MLCGTRSQPDVRAAPAAADLDNSKELRNRFNFSERAAQTSALHPKDKVTATEPPPTLELSASCSQAAIYAEYVRDQERIEAQERAAKSKAAAKKVRLALSLRPDGPRIRGGGRSGEWCRAHACHCRASLVPASL